MPFPLTVHALRAAKRYGLRRHLTLNRQDCVAEPDYVRPPRPRRTGVLPLGDTYKTAHEGDGAMGKVIVAATMSLDGYVADPDDKVGPLFEWYGNGEVEATGADTERVFRVTQISADYIRTVWTKVGACVIGRKLFDITNGWHGRPAVGDHVFVVTHEPPTGWGFPDAPFTFVTDGVASAIEQAKAFAGGRDVTVTAGDVGGQALATGLVDEVSVAQVPVVFGTGIPFFGTFDQGPFMLENPRIVQGDRVTHMDFPVRKA
jgi:dihydrofolate reductase